ncbi:ribosome biogenesis GTP-binding protein YihA/YsxC [Pontivivens nitratireducens]|uniref:ribosome biogenesis GTP-binding protein YihA/YsxC n=1 Tax=Pontivivens nitratireducens TaxID=2758038 RepID=UPI00163B1975|nr:ribosome biogenesis GTP-binding protein YihA/YsxC [Pontibrevibacter nitratireducens]
MTPRFPLAETPDAAALAKGRSLFLGPCEFVKGVVAMEGLPPADRLEFCMAGRSNVGKSSLINALTGRKALARTSNTPGRTQEINFFALADTHYMVDLPGYGFAKAPVAVVAKWQALLKNYLAGRQTLRRVFLLIDSRHGAKEVDEEIMSVLDRAAVPFHTVMTKIDKPRPAELEASLERTRQIIAKHPTAYPEIILTSSDKGDGVETLRAIIAGLN